MEDEELVFLVGSRRSVTDGSFNFCEKYLRVSAVVGEGWGPACLEKTIH